MGSLNKFAAAAGFSLVLAAGGAQAADMGGSFLEPLMPVEVGSSWYLRGDIGYKVYTSPSATYTFSSTTGRVLDANDESINNALIVGGGVGYKFNPWFRTDATVDYETRAGYTGSVACVAVTCGNSYYSVTGNIAAWTILANAYFDLGTWNGFTPYIGGGIGTSNIALSGYTQRNGPGDPAGLRIYGHDMNQWNFAWALTAGASYEITPNWLIDMNYRYVSLGDVHSIDQNSNAIDINNIAASEVRVGVRFLID
jgi:opacity protein-like surface antigen